MATFYILPPQEHFEAEVEQFLNTWFPGVVMSRDTTMKVLDALLGTATETSAIQVIFRDQLPGLGTTIEDVVSGFGGEVGDEIITVSKQAIQSHQTIEIEHSRNVA